MTMSNEEFEQRTGLSAIDAALIEQMRELMQTQMATWPPARRDAFIADLSPRQRQMLYSIGMPTDLGDATAVEEWLRA